MSTRKYPSFISLTKNKSSWTLRDTFLSPTVLKSFQQYCKVYHADENVEILLNIQHFNQIHDEFLRRRCASIIYTRFCTGPKEININDETKRRIKNAIDNPHENLPKDIFQSVRLQIEYLLQDIHRRFVNSI